VLNCLILKDGSRIQQPASRGLSVHPCPASGPTEVIAAGAYFPIENVKTREQSLQLQLDAFVSGLSGISLVSGPEVSPDSKTARSTLLRRNDAVLL